MSILSFCLCITVFDILSYAVVVDVEYSHVRFLGNLVLNLWDCGG